MAFTPRTFETILAEMEAYCKAYTTLSDYTVGSATRTILEAAALEDDEQYFQMTQILEAFSILTARGDNLDRRVADFGIFRRDATAAVGSVQFTNTLATTNLLAFDSEAATTSLSAYDTSAFPTTGFPYVIRVAEGTNRAQDVSVNGNNTATGEFSLVSGLQFKVFTGDRVTLVTGSVAKIANIGTQLQVPPTVTEAAKLYTTTETASIAPGNYYSNYVLARATTAGRTGNAGAGRVSRFVGSSPFNGAGITNATAMQGGFDREGDSALQQRALAQIPALSRGTVQAILAGVVGVIDEASGKQVVSAGLIEYFDEDEVVVYIDDGSGLIPSVVNTPNSLLATGVTIGDEVIELTSNSDFPNSGYLLIEYDGTNAAELLSYSAKNGNVFYLDDPAVDNHVVLISGTTVRFVSPLTLSSEVGQTRFTVQNFPLVRDSLVVYVKVPSGIWTEVDSADYHVNKGNGELRFSNGGYATGTQIVTTQSYYTGLIAEVQKVVEGSRADRVNYPGIKAAGIEVSVEAPNVRRIDVNLSIQAVPGVSEDDLYDSVRSAVESYILNLGVGEDVVVSKIVEAAHTVSQVYSVTVVTPTSTIVMLENELAVPYSASGTSLVTIT